MTKAFNNRYFVTFLLYKVEKQNGNDSVHAEMNKYIKDRKKKSIKSDPSKPHITVDPTTECKISDLQLE